jgi:hypothetical protein
MRIYTFPNCQEKVQQAIALWNDGLSTSQIAAKLNKSRASISMYLKYAGVNMLARRYSTYFMNESYFDIINTSNKAYWLGFLLADGNISKNARMLKVELQYRDKGHLDLFKEHIEFTGPIKTGKHMDKRTGKVYLSTNLMLCSMKLTKALLSKEWSEFKNHGSLEIINRVPKNLRVFLLRGLFDGDGSIGWSAGQACMTFIDMHKSVVEWYQSELITKLGLSKVRVYPCTKTNSAWIFRYGGNRQMKRIMKFLYEDNGPHLTRKYERYLKLMNQ